MKTCDKTKQIDPYIKAIEVLNSQNIALVESCEYVTGQKVLNWGRIIKQRMVISKFRDFFRHRKASIRETVSLENFDDSEWKKYLHLGDPNKRIVIYSCITGDYDDYKEPLLALPNIKYVMYVDSSQVQGDSAWEFRTLPEKIKLDNQLINRYIKMHPFEFFSKEYDYSIYIDGNVQPISDMSVMVEMIDKEIGFGMHKHRYRDCIFEEEQICEWKGKGNKDEMRAQVNRYKKEGFPPHFGLSECTVIVTDLKSCTAKMIYSKWWEEFIQSKSYRDQLSFPYICWKFGIEMKNVNTLGRNLYRNRKLRICSHLL